MAFGADGSDYKRVTFQSMSAYNAVLYCDGSDGNEEVVYYFLLFIL